MRNQGGIGEGLIGWVFTRQVQRVLFPFWLKINALITAFNAFLEEASSLKCQDLDTSNPGQEVLFLEFLIVLVPG